MKIVFTSRALRVSMLAAGVAATLVAATSRSQAQTLVNVSAITTGINGNTLLGFVPVTLGPGTYTVTPTNPSLNPSALYTAWSYNTPWTWYTLGYDSANVVGSAPLVNIDFGNANSSAGTPVQAYQQTYTEPTFATPAQAYATVAGKTQFFTLTTTKTIDFVTNDNVPSDNQGGVSFVISNGAAPEPGALALAASALPLAGGIMIRRRRRTDA